MAPVTRRPRPSWAASFSRDQHVLFSSPWYLAFLALVLLALAPPASVETKKRMLAVASCFFYAFWDYRYLGLLLLISVIDYYCARAIARSAGPARRAWLLVSLCSNLGILAYFKYFNFFVDNLNGLLPQAAQIAHRDILLPAGVSFYTFKTLSYVIDVYRRELPLVRSQMDYTTFITFFPELIAGPIVRASVFLPQLDRDIGPTAERLSRGASLFLLGFTKKLMADRLASMVDPVFADPAAFSSASAWAATLGYSFQIYCDFSGYSDMAIGSAAMIGYQLPENFRMPYLAAGITDFWRRWHITLSSWLRDYLYIPLGGNRQGPLRTYVNLMLTMLLGGLWHGASWNFVLWGGLHGIALAIERAVQARRPGALLPAWISIPATFAFVSLCWIPFRCATFATTGAFLHRLATPGDGIEWISPDLLFVTIAMAIGHAIGAGLEPGSVAGLRLSVSRLVGWFGLTSEQDALGGRHLGLVTGRFVGLYLVLLWAMLAFLLTPTRISPFIYFQF